MEYSSEFIPFDEQIAKRAIEHENTGLTGMDALHVACAEKARADFFVTCDDRLVKNLKKMSNVGVTGCGLIEFVSQEVFKK